MGVLFSQLPLLDACHRHGGLQSPLYALGSLQFPNTAEFMSEWARKQGYERMAAEPTVASLFRERYGVEEYLDIDLNEEAAIRLDLSRPLPEELRGRAGTVYDGGTLEHIFDLRQAMENVHSLLRPGGTFVIFAPVTWWQHGFVNFNPKFFAAFARANDYERLVEGFWFRVRVPPVKRFVTVVTWERGTRPRQRLWVGRVMNRLQPSRTLYFSCMRKLRDDAFRVPGEVFGNW